jgi:tyrosinase
LENGANFMGGNGRVTDNRVMTGPFAYDTGNWTLAIDGPDLKRALGQSAPALPTPADVSSVLTQTPYDIAPWDTTPASGFRNILEGWQPTLGLHNLVHVWVGGSMLPGSSPNDPVFWLHHCFIDKLWADWQALHPGFGYLPNTPTPNVISLNDPMEPWASRGQTVTPASVLNHQALGYAYDTEAVCAPKHKFLDDPGFKKLLDDPIKLKFRDDPLNIKAIEDVKLAGFDTGGLPPPFTGTPAPFVLATPHHSMAWTGGQAVGTSAQPAVSDELTATVHEYGVALAVLQQLNQEGGLTESGLKQFEDLQQRYQQLLAALQQLR